MTREYSIEYKIQTNIEYKIQTNIEYKVQTNIEYKVQTNRNTNRKLLYSTYFLKNILNYH